MSLSLISLVTTINISVNIFQTFIFAGVVLKWFKSFCAIAVSYSFNEYVLILHDLMCNFKYVCWHSVLFPCINTGYKVCRCPSFPWSQLLISVLISFKLSFSQALSLNDLIVWSTIATYSYVSPFCLYCFHYRHPIFFRWLFYIHVA